MSSQLEVETGDISTLENEEDDQKSITNDDSAGTSSTIVQEITKPVDMSSSTSMLPTIMVAGRARNGKSTALNNIFDLHLVAKTAAKSVTKVISVNEVTKKVPIPGKGNVVETITMQVIDTPGLGALDIPKEDIMKEMKKITSGKEYTLLYCYSVAPNTALTETDKAIIFNLHLALGKEIWKKCVLLFTFSDYAAFEFDDDTDSYIDHIKNHATEFQKLLKDITGEDHEVKSIFDYESLEDLEKEEKPSGIIAIPVRKTTKKSKQVLLDMIKADQDWTDIAFLELMKRTDESQREPFILFKYPMVVLTSSATAAGAVTGAVVGGLVGGRTGWTTWSGCRGWSYGGSGSWRNHCHYNKHSCKFDSSLKSKT